jgi:hypothetical protein
MLPSTDTDALIMEVPGIIANPNGGDDAHLTHMQNDPRVHSSLWIAGRSHEGLVLDSEVVTMK